MKYFFFIEFALLFHSFQCSLILVIETFRHGAREPLTDFWNAKEFKSKGELTPVGMRQHYVLGQLLRLEYIENLNFLTPTYNATELYVYSTNVNRTIISAMSQLLGLYPLGSGPDIPTNMNYSLLLPPFNNSFKIAEDNSFNALPNAFQPIPIHTNGLEQEYLLRPWEINVCKVNKRWYLEQYNTSFFKEITLEFNETLRNVGDMVNVSKDAMDFWKMHHIYDVFQNDIFSGKDLPQDFDKYSKNMSFIYDILVYFIDFGTPLQKRTLSTPFFENLINIFEAKIKGIDKRKWIMYSAHDITLITILAGLNYTSYECLYQGWRQGGVYDKLCQHFPTYASNLLFELHNDTNVYKVKVRYNGEYLMEYEYNAFIQKLKGSIVDNFMEICNDEVSLHVNDNKSKGNESFSGWGLFFIGLIIGCLLTGITAYFLLKKYSKKNSKEENLNFAAEMENYGDNKL